MNSILWRCPLCHEPLKLVGRSFACANRHSFDQAKEGYVNLLRVNRKHSADPGDNKEMLESRRHFLQQGFYAPLAAGLGEAIRQYFPDPSQPLTLLDAGCGEGYYLQPTGATPRRKCAMLRHGYFAGGDALGGETVPGDAVCGGFQL